MINKLKEEYPLKVVKYTCNSEDGVRMEFVCNGKQFLYCAHKGKETFERMAFTHKDGISIRELRKICRVPAIDETEIYVSILRIESSNRNKLWLGVDIMDTDALQGTCECEAFEKRHDVSFEC